MIGATMGICASITTAVWGEWVVVSLGGSVVFRAAREDGLRRSLGGGFGGCAIVPAFRRSASSESIIVAPWASASTAARFRHDGGLSRELWACVGGYCARSYGGWWCE
jgi:hypothetical protein